MKKIIGLFTGIMILGMFSCQKEENTPEMVVKAVYTVEEENFDTVRDFFIPIVEEDMDTDIVEDVDIEKTEVTVIDETGVTNVDVEAVDEESEDVLMGIWREQTLDWSVESIEVVQEKISEEKGEARLILNITFDDGVVQEGIPADLLYMNGSWKLSID